MNKLGFALLLLSARAFADGSPYVVAYNPPPVEDRAHKGLTLELSFGPATTSIDNSTGGGTLAVGGWVTREAALAFRVTEIGSYGFVGGSLQYFAAPHIWVGGGAGALSERTMDQYGGIAQADGGGGFIRAGYELASSGRNALYLSGEVQAGSVGGEGRVLAFAALGWQLL